jgi:heterodisulfide reductase subunit B
MKITITEEQYQKLLEADLSYTPEKIDEFIRQAMKALDESETAKNKYHMDIMTLTIEEVFNNKEGYEKLAEKINTHHEEVEKHYNKFYKIVEMYDFLNLPDNVRKLEKINERIYDTAQHIYHLSNALEEIVSAVEYLNRIDEN